MQYLTSGRYESSFRFDMGKYDANTNKLIYKTPVGTSSSVNARDTTKQATGLPVTGYAFSAVYNDFSLIAQNRYNSVNNMGLNPSLRAAWFGYQWKKVPNEIKIFEQYLYVTSITKSGFYSLIKGNVKYMIGLGFLHALKVENNMDDSITIEYRGMDKYHFDPVLDTGDVMFMDWEEQVIPAGEAFMCRRYEPLEVRFDTDNLPTGENVSIVLQDGTKYLFFN